MQEAVEHMTIGDIVGTIVFFAGAITAGKIISGFFTKRVETIVTEIVTKQIEIFRPKVEGFNTAIADVNEKIDKSLEAIHQVDIDNAKNYLQQVISAIEGGTVVDESTKIRFGEVYDHYCNDLHLNSWVHSAVDKLRKEGKL